MKAHSRIYMKFFGYQIITDAISEFSESPCEAVHHIDKRGMGGNPSGDKDNILNLMGLTTIEHPDADNGIPSYDEQRLIHYKFIVNSGCMYKLKDPELNHLHNFIENLT